MLFLIIERFRNGDAAPVYQRFRERGRLAPEGLRYVDSWVTQDLATCYQVMECDDRALLDAWMANWNDLVEFEVLPVMTSAEAAARVPMSAAQARGSERPALRLRDVLESDIPVFYEQQADPEATQLSALQPREREAFMAHWAKLLLEPANIVRTIEADGEPAGHVCSFPRDGQQEVGYWLARSHWGRGVLSWALPEFLRSIAIRPLHAHTAQRNTASVRALLKCGFVIEREVSDFAGERGDGSRGFVMRLD